MVEQAKNPKLIEAEENVAEAKRILGITAPRLADRLLSITQGDVDLVKDLMADVANVAGNTATLAVAERRLSSEKYPKDSEDSQKLNPDFLSPMQESRLFGTGAAHQIVDTSSKIGKNQ